MPCCKCLALAKAVKAVALRGATNEFIPKNDNPALIILDDFNDPDRDPSTNPNVAQTLENRPRG